MLPKFIANFFKQIAYAGYSDFYTISDIQKNMCTNMVCWSWGAHEYRNIGHKFLSFKVQGRKYTGYVFVGLNGADMLDIYFTNQYGTIENKIDDIGIENLIYVIDKFVETD